MAEPSNERNAQVADSVVGQSTIALAFVSLVLTAYDLRTLFGRAHGLPWPSVVAALWAAWALLFSLAVMPVLVRVGLRPSAARVSHVALLYALEAAAIAWLIVGVERYATYRPTPLLAFAWVLGAASAGGLVALVLKRYPRLAPVCSLILASLAWFAILRLLPMRQKPTLLIALHYVLLTALCTLFAPLLPALRVRARVVVPIAGAALLSAMMMIQSSHAVRSLVLRYAASANVLLRPLSRQLSARARAPELGPVVCVAGRKLTSSNTSSLSGVQVGADVLLLSIDALRWDHAFALPKTFAALGSHVRFSRATTPATATRFALSAVLRGVSAREVFFEPKKLFKGAHSPPTMAQLLVARGYRAVQVPTHRFFDPRTHIAEGFEVAQPRALTVFPTRALPRPPTVSHEDALRTALETAQRVRSPLLLWTHLMESHDPYQWRGGRGPLSREGQLHALRDLDGPLAAFIESFRRARKGRPLVLVLFGDHGEEFLEHRGKRHGTSAYAEVSRVAFALAFDGAPHARIEAPVSTGAIAGTVFDLIGADTSTFTLPSLLPCIARGEHCPEIAETEQVGSDGWLGYTGRRYRLLYHAGTDVTLLFDADRDRYEQRDLAGSPEHASRLVVLRRLARAYDEAHCVAGNAEALHSELE